MKVYVVHTWPDYETGEIVGARREPEAAMKLAENHAFHHGGVIGSWSHAEGTGSWTARLHDMYTYEVMELDTAAGPV